MDSSVRFFLPALFLLAFLFLSACTQEQPPGPGGQVTPPPINASSNATNLLNATAPCGDGCLLGKALASLDQSLCANISLNATRDDCYLGISKSDCSKVIDSGRRDSCYLSQAKDSTELCLNYSSPDYCYLNVTSCGTMDCAAAKLDDPALCVTQQCNYDFALKGNSQACPLLNDSVSQTACAKIAGTGTCASLTNEFYQYKCWSTVAYQKEDYSFCQKITTNASLYFNGCVTDLAVKITNSSFCDLIRDTEFRDDCYYDYAQTTADVSQCLNIKYYDQQQNDCMYRVALKFARPDFCNNMTFSNYRTTCYSGVILSGNPLTPDSCATVQDQIWGDKCFMQLALNSRKPVYCESIKDAGDRQTCKDRFYPG